MNKYVLIVEDNDIASRIQKRILENLGCDVDCAMTGEDSVNLASLNRYDLILMDIGLPGLNGIEATSLIRSNNSDINNKLTPIVAVTANEDPNIRERCINAGMNGVFSKPFTLVSAKELITTFCPEKEV